ncbi:hypothetical protein [Loktanella sp. S4079]|uniref:hypothetical protein n=1 Tax=Loktanella sp. S4079 TaxID=579483 RepID=UPI000695E35A|nr:hypothetical protein [Loktanella sp. S4079]
MENKITKFAARQAPYDDIAVLCCVDRLLFDPKPINQLIASKSITEAEEIICRVLEELAAHITALQRQLARRDLAAMLRPCRKVRLIADQIGLIEMAVTADHIQTCLKQADGVALEATMARLERAFDFAVIEVWNFRQR